MKMLIVGFGLGAFATIHINTNDPVLKNLVQLVMTDEAFRKVASACEAGLKDTVILVTRDVKAESPYLTGNNRGSIDFQRITPLHWEVFSTSGYGGWLAIGTRGRSPDPYFTRPLDRHMPGLPNRIKEHLV